MRLPARRMEGGEFLVFPVTRDRSALFVAQGNTLFLVSRETAERFRRGPDALASQERAEWESLTRAGVVGARCAETVRRTGARDGAYLAVNLNLTSRCNLACVYCFAKGGGYGALDGDLKPDVVEDVIELLRRQRTDAAKIRFEYFGGEPLLNLECIEAFCEASERIAERLGVEVVHRISTNLTFLPRRAARLFDRFGFTVSVSIDGGRKTHDRNRPGRNGRRWYDDILRHCRSLREQCPRVKLVARVTLNDRRVPLVENVRALWRENLFDYFQILPAISPSLHPAGVPDGAVDELTGLIEAYPSLFSAGAVFRGLLELERIAQMVLEGKAALSHCSAGRNYFTVSEDRSVAPCHRLVGQPEHVVGEVTSARFSNLAPWLRGVDARVRCRSCWARYLCGGGCRQVRLLLSGGSEEPPAQVCRYETGLAEGILRLIATSGGDYQHHDRAPLEDLFVSCGRPVVRIRSPVSPGRAQAFTPLVSGGAERASG